MSIIMQVFSLFTKISLIGFVLFLGASCTRGRTNLKPGGQQANALIWIDFTPMDKGEHNCKLVFSGRDKEDYYLALKTGAHLYSFRLPRDIYEVRELNCNLLYRFKLNSSPRFGVPKSSIAWLGHLNMKHKEQGLTWSFKLPEKEFLEDFLMGAAQQGMRSAHTGRDIAVEHIKQHQTKAHYVYGAQVNFMAFREMYHLGDCREKELLNSPSSLGKLQIKIAVDGKMTPKIENVSDHSSYSKSMMRCMRSKLSTPPTTNLGTGHITLDI